MAMSNVIAAGLRVLTSVHGIEMGCHVGTEIIVQLLNLVMHSHIHRWLARRQGNVGLEAGVRALTL